MDLTIDHLGKRYGQHWVLRDLSLNCAPGLIGLVGPNGSGKTTLMRIITTLLPPTEGSILWNGRDMRSSGSELRQTLGYLPQEFGFYPEFTGRQFLRYLAAMKGLPQQMAQRRTQEVLEMVNLTDTADHRLTTYSGGMKQRLGIAQALLNDPELLVVDEPTAGLDPQERVRFRTLLASLTASRIVLLSTHIIGDVEAVASRLIILHRGQALVDTTPGELTQRATGKVWEVTVDGAMAARLQERYRVSTLVSQGGDAVLMRVLGEQRPIEQAAPVDPTLEEAYLLAIGASG